MIPGLDVSWDDDEEESPPAFRAFLLGVFESAAPKPKNWRGLKGWSWLGELMIVSQMTACERGVEEEEEEEGEVEEEGHEATM